MAKGKVGLQKEVSRIFTGIQVPKKNAQETAKHPAAGEQGRTTSGMPDRTTVPAPVIKPTPVVLPTPVAQPMPQVLPQAAVSPAPAIAQKPVITPKPVTPAPRPFTIPEPHNAGSASQKPEVYEQHATRQAIYEPPTPAPKYSPARQPRPEMPLSKPSWQSALIKIWQPLSDKFLAPQPGVNPVRQKATVAMIAVLPFVLIFMLSKTLITPAKPGVKSPKASGTAVVVSDGRIEWEIPPVFPENIRDPMVFGAVSSTTQEETAGPVVKGIVYSEDNPCAVVGDRIVSAGDVVGGATVVKINPDSVEFAAGGKNWSQKVER
jgi:hypothetical protein